MRTTQAVLSPREVAAAGDRSDLVRSSCLDWDLSSCCGSYGQKRKYLAAKYDEKL